MKLWVDDPSLTAGALLGGLRSGVRGCASIFWGGLVEHFFLDKVSQGFDELVCIGAFGLDFEPCSDCGREHANLHDTFSVNTGLAAADGEVGIEPVGEVDELHSRAHMESVSVLYFELRFANEFIQGIFLLLGP
jgi:hypothetical protein